MDGCGPDTAGPKRGPWSNNGQPAGSKVTRGHKTDRQGAKRVLKRWIIHSACLKLQSSKPKERVTRVYYKAALQGCITIHIYNQVFYG